MPGKQNIIGFKQQFPIIRLQLRGGIGEKYDISSSFTIRLRNKATQEQLEDLRDFLLEAAKDWYEELKQ